MKLPRSVTTAAYPALFTPPMETSLAFFAQRRKLPFHRVVEEAIDFSALLIEASHEAVVVYRARHRAVGTCIGVIDKRGLAVLVEEGVIGVVHIEKRVADDPTGL